MQSFFALKKKKDIFLQFVLCKFTNLRILLRKSVKKLLTKPPFCGYNSNCRKMGAGGRMPSCPRSAEIPARSFERRCKNA